MPKEVDALYAVAVRRGVALHCTSTGHRGGLRTLVCSGVGPGDLGSASFTQLVQLRGIQDRVLGHRCLNGWLADGAGKPAWVIASDLHGSIDGTQPIAAS